MFLFVSYMNLKTVNGSVRELWCTLINAKLFIMICCKLQQLQKLIGGWTAVAMWLSRFLVAKYQPTHGTYTLAWSHMNKGHQKAHAAGLLIIKLPLHKQATYVLDWQC